MKKLFIGIIALITTYSAYSLELVLTKSEKTKNNEVMLKEFLDEVKAKLPPVMVGALDTLNISFANLNGDKKELDLPVCVNELMEMKKEERTEIASHRNIYGYQRGSTIVLDERFLSEIKLKDQSRKINCRHQNFYRYAVATALHEISHAYSRLRVQRVGERAKVYKTCLGRGSNERRNFLLEKKCSALLREYFGGSISGQEEYRAIAGYSLGLFSSNSKNTDPMVSPDAYEASSIEEHYAVNMEYFLMDSEYQCRRPALFQYFSKHFKFNPHPEVSCAKKLTFRLSSGQLFDVDPARVSSIDYFLADAGDDFSSKWGHAMYRIVQCAPHRKVVNAECRFDHPYHIILSARANVDDVVLDMLKGFFGGYSSQLFAIPLSEVLSEYNEGELRDLVSVPLEISKSEVTSFLEAANLNHWGYRGDYKFVTNNCAQESNSLLQAALAKTRSYVTLIDTITPTGFYEELIKNGLVKRLDKEKLESTKQSMLFPALHKVMVTQMAQVFKTPNEMDKDSFLKLVKEQKLKSFVDQFEIQKVVEIQDSNVKDVIKRKFEYIATYAFETEEKRNQEHEKYTNYTDANWRKEARVQHFGLFSTLTGKVRAIKSRSGQKEVMDFLYKLSESENQSETQAEVKKIFEEQKALAAGTKKYLGYGIPSEQSIKDLKAEKIANNKPLSDSEIIELRTKELKTQKLVFSAMTESLKKVYVENLAWVSFYKKVRMDIYNFKNPEKKKEARDFFWSKYLTASNLDKLFEEYQEQQLQELIEELREKKLKQQLQ
jgi:hypothetical protein